MPKITAFHGSEVDMGDAHVRYLILPEGLSVKQVSDEWNKWYRDEYIPAYRACEKMSGPWIERNAPKFKTCIEWLIERGARAPMEDELEIMDTP